MSIYYPAIFEEEETEKGIYNIVIPDIPNCRTYGVSIENGVKNATEVIEVCIDHITSNGGVIPKSSNPNSYDLKKSQFIIMIEYKSLDYMRKTYNKAVKKTLTIPEWMNIIGEEKNINFSNVLQNSLNDMFTRDV